MQPSPRFELERLQMCLEAATHHPTHAKMLKCFQKCLTGRAPATPQPIYMKTYAKIMEAWQCDSTSEDPADRRSSPAYPLFESSWPMPAMPSAALLRHSDPRGRQPQSLRASMTEDVLIDNGPVSQRLSARRSLDMSEPPCTYEITVPEHARPGDKLHVITDNGDKLRITVADGARAGDTLTFVHTRSGRQQKTQGRRFSTHGQRCDEAGKDTRKSLRARMVVGGKENSKLMEVDVPVDARVGDVLTVLTPNGLVSLTVPAGADPGDTLEFMLPRSHQVDTTATAQRSVRKRPAEPAVAPAAAIASSRDELETKAGALRDGHVIGEVTL